MANLTADEVLLRYKDLPDFLEISLTDANQTGGNDDRPLHVASVRGDMEEVAALVSAGAEINVHGDLGYTPLHEAVGQGHLEVVKFLLKNGACLTALNEFGDTAADIARLENREDIVELLDSWGTNRV